MPRAVIAVALCAALSACGRGAEEPATIAPEPAARGVTAVEGSAELAPSAFAGSRPAAGATADASGPARNVSLSITGMT